MSEEFDILDERTHVLKRPGMFIGSTTLEPVKTCIDGEWKTINIVGGFVKIVSEIIDNAVDEAIRTDFKFANRIDVSIKNSLLEGSVVSVKDNGRGIPVEEVNGKNVMRPTAAFTM